MRKRVFLGTMIVTAVLAAGATAQARRATTPEPLKVTEPATTWASGTQPMRDCGRARRKFWLPQEGWIVRTVVSCR